MTDGKWLCEVCGDDSMPSKNLNSLEIYLGVQHGVGLWRKCPIRGCGQRVREKFMERHLSEKQLDYNNEMEVEEEGEIDDEEYEEDE